MLTYAELKNNPRQFLAVTSLSVEEFEALRPEFAEAYAATQSATHTQAGQLRRRRVGGGRCSRLEMVEDKLLFILIYFKLYPIQTAHGLQFGLSQAQTSDWIRRLLPVLHQSLKRLGYVPDRTQIIASTAAPTTASSLAFQLDGTERRRQRPQAPEKQAKHYSGKKNAHRQKPAHR
jgi:hypothetical protein